MPWPWLLFATLTVVGSLTYNVGMRYGAAEANAFGFSVVIAAVVLIATSLTAAVARYGFGVPVTQGLQPYTLKYAVMIGIGVAIVDINYFFAVRTGSVMASQMFWTIGGIIALAVFSHLMLAEPVTPLKAVGILFGIASVVLMTWQTS